jgi:hypothetical protein
MKAEFVSEYGIQAVFPGKVEKTVKATGTVTFTCNGDSYFAAFRISNKPNVAPSETQVTLVKAIYDWMEYVSEMSHGLHIREYNAGQRFRLHLQDEE